MKELLSAFAVCLLAACLTPGVPAAFGPNGTDAVEQMYVQYSTPSQVKGVPRWTTNHEATNS